MKVGFMPILPHPVTEYATTTNSKTNLQTVWTKMLWNYLMMMVHFTCWWTWCWISLIFFWLFSSTRKLSFEEGFTLKCSKIPHWNWCNQCSNWKEGLWEESTCVSSVKESLRHVVTGYVYSIWSFYSFAWKVFWKTKQCEISLG